MIAVVDDEESVRNAVVRLLQAVGYTARGFASGQRFLQSWDNDKTDCLMLDLQMPELSGLDVQRALKRAGAQIPVIILTAHDSPRAREECRHEGAVAYLSKPPDKRVLVDALELLGIPLVSA